MVVFLFRRVSIVCLCSAYFGCVFIGNVVYLLM